MRRSTAPIAAARYAHTAHKRSCEMSPLWALLKPCCLNPEPPGSFARVELLLCAVAPALTHGQPTSLAAPLLSWMRAHGCACVRCVPRLCARYLFTHTFTRTRNHTDTHTYTGAGGSNEQQYKYTHNFSLSLSLSLPLSLFLCLSLSLSLSLSLPLLSLRRPA